MNNYDVQEVLSHKDDVCITLVLETKDAAFNRDKIKNEYKNHIRSIEATMSGQTEKETLLKPLKDLLNNQTLWLNLKESLVVYRSTKLFKALCLPYPVANQLTIDKRFISKYIMPYIFDTHPFKVLWIGNNDVKFYEGNTNLIDPSKVPNLPKKIGDISEMSENYRVRAHSPSSPHGQSTGFSSFYSGIGEDDKEAQEDIRRFFRAIDKALMNHLRGNKDPLVLVGVESMLHHFKNNSEHPHILDSFVTNPDAENIKDLHQLALEIVKKEAPNEAQKLRLWVKEHEGEQPSRIINLKDDIIKASKDELIETLLIWFEEEVGEQDWIEDCVRQVYAQKGKVIEWYQTAAVLYYPKQP